MRSTTLLAIGLTVAVVLAVNSRDCRGESASDGNVRGEINAALATAFPATPEGRKAQAQLFLKLYAATADLPSVDRSRLRTRLKSRLSRLAQAIGKDSLHAKDTADPATSSAADSAVESSKPAQGRPGGGPQNDGQALVELIEATIAPESWDVNGGQGVIRYWPAWQVLVVRQTDDVHEQIGGVVQRMRK